MNKPRPPKINREELSKRKADTNNITKLKARLKLFEDERRDGKKPTTYIAFETLAALYGGRLEGHTDEELREAWPSDWGSETLLVPAALINALSSAWFDYQKAPSGKTLGEAFKLEGGGQGKKRIKDIQNTSDKTRNLSYQVELQYLSQSGTSHPISLEDVYANVAEEYKVSDETVRKAHQKYGSFVRRTLKEQGIITK